MDLELELFVHQLDGCIMSVIRICFTAYHHGPIVTNI